MIRRRASAAFRAVVMASLVMAAPAAFAAPAKKQAAKKTALKPKGEPAACAALHADYENASKLLALNFSQNAIDRSAIRAAARNSEDSNTLEKARFTMDLLRTNGCKAPTAAPAKERYLHQAMQCQLGLLQMQTRRIQTGQDFEMPPECNKESWKPED